MYTTTLLEVCGAWGGEGHSCGKGRRRNEKKFKEKRMDSWIKYYALI